MVERAPIRRADDELESAYEHHRTADRRSMAMLSAYVDSLPTSATVLDAGCGHGSPVLTELSEVGEAVGIDIWWTQLGLAAQNAPAATLVQADMTALPFSRQRFDAIVAFWSMIHVPLAAHQPVPRRIHPGMDDEWTVVAL